jgi:anthranilate phosphoribosyltransferase
MNIGQTIGAMLDGVLKGTALDGALQALAERPITTDDILSGREAIMARATLFTAPGDAIDVCGTGGDGKHSLNVSTAVAFVVAASGMPVVKHGNRAVSSRSGGSDVLAALGIRADLPAAFWERALAQANIAFLHAPNFHPGFAHIASARKALGKRTLFNVLGPLCNPAQVKRQVMGVYAGEILLPVAEALQRIGTTHAWVVYGEDGMDELSVSGASQVYDVTQRAVTEITVSPQDAGLPPADADALRGGEAAYNAEAIEALFRGERGGYRKTVVLNAAAALLVAGKVENLTDGANIANETIESGKARHTLEQLRELASQS